MWDVRSGECIHTLYDHQADIYGLDSHKDRPFVFASSSRDTSLRFWSVENLVMPVKLRCLLNKGVFPKDCIGTVAQAMEEKSVCLLAGPVSKQVREECQSRDEVSAVAKACLFFSGNRGLKDLWRLVRRLKGITAPCAELSGDDTVIAHMDDLADSSIAEAKGLEVSRGLGRKKAAERCEEAAIKYLKLGDLRKYCEIMVQLNKWEKALSIAPGVSMAYWRQLSKQYSDHLAESEPADTIIPHLIANGDRKGAVKILMAHDQLEDALLLTSVNGGDLEDSEPETGLTESKSDQADQDSSPISSSKSDSSSISGSLRELTSLLANKYFLDGESVLAACCFLSIGDPKGAIQVLLRADEFELAWVIAKALEVSVSEPLSLYMARRCEESGLVDETLQLYRETKNGRVQSILYGARCSNEKRSDLVSRGLLDNPELLLEMASKASINSIDNAVEVAACFIGAGDDANAVDTILPLLKELLSQPMWDLTVVEQLVLPLYSVNCENISNEVKNQILSYCSFLGAQRSFLRGYVDVCSFFVNNTFELAKKSGSVFPVPEAVLQMQLLRLLSSAAPNRAVKLCRTLMAEGNLDDVGQRCVNQYLQMIGDGYYNRERKVDQFFESNMVIPTGSLLPSANRSIFQHSSCITEAPIAGPAFRLAPSGLAVSVAEASQVYRCTHFSPAGDGSRISLLH